MLTNDISIPATVLVFRIGDQLCALPVECVKEVIHRPELLFAPGQPTILEGFLNLRGHAWPVIHLRRLLDLSPAAPDLYSPLILVKLGSQEAAFEVDDVETVDKTDSTLRPFGGDISPNDCALGVVTVGDRDVTLLSCERMLLDQEAACLAELQAAMEHRLQDLGSMAG